MERITNFIIKHKTHAIIISIALIILLYTIVFYEATRRNITSASNDRISFLQYQIDNLHHEISIRDTRYFELQTKLATAQYAITDTHARHSALMESYENLQQQHDTTYEQFRDLQYRYWNTSHYVWMFDLYNMYAPTITHATACPNKVDMIIRHLTAMYTGDLQGYLATVSGGDTWEYPGAAFSGENWNWEADDWTWTDWMLLTFRDISEREYYRMNVRFIPGRNWWPEQHVLTWVLAQETPDCEPVLWFHSLHVSRENGVWRVHDYH